MADGVADCVADQAAAGIVARSPLPCPDPVEIHSGWSVCTRRSTATLRLADRTPLAKVLVRAAPDGRMAARLGVPFGRAARAAAVPLVAGTLVVGSAPGEWLLLGAPGSASALVAGVERTDDRLVSVLDYTHGRALMRLSGSAAAETLAKLCPIDLADRVTPDGAAFRSAVAQLATDVVRDDVAGTRSYLLHCERSSGRYLFDAIYDAGGEFGIEVDGFAFPERSSGR